MLGAAVASLGAVAEALVRSSSKDAVGVATVVLGVLAVILSWALVNTVYALKYARQYYCGGDGGIDFGQEQPPPTATSPTSRSRWGWPSRSRTPS